MSPQKENFCRDEVIEVTKGNNTLVLLSKKKLIFKSPK
uniref:Uncharacterized protein n=1 Tax=Vitis vinifera TaxID=29760 RepID=F6HT26_VITVI